MTGYTLEKPVAQRSMAAPAAAHAATAKAGWAAFGGILGALASTSCCIAPLVLFMLGISGAWIGDLTALEPYQPIFFAATAAFLGTGYYLAYRRPKTACAEGSCALGLPCRITRISLWTASALVLLAVLFKYLGGYIAPPLLSL